MPREFVDMIWDHWDKGTGTAVLALYRGADSPELASAGRALNRIECPSLVVAGDRDPYVPVRFGEAYATALPDSELRIVSGAGHWPWVERPALVGEILDFLA